MMPSKHGQNNRLKIPKGVSDKKLAFRRTLRVKKKKKQGSQSYSAEVQMQWSASVLYKLLCRFFQALARVKLGSRGRQLR